MVTASYSKHELAFKRQARTSRGAMENHIAYYVILKEGNRTGIGEAAPLKGLSIDDRSDFENKLKECIAYIHDGLPVDALDLTEFPSLQFAFETASLSLKFEKPFTVFENSFMQGMPISINGLVWMNSRDEMLEEAYTKAAEGFSCIKFKVGALDFDEECRMLEAFRKRYSSFKVELRLDANGAFATDEAEQKLKELSRFGIHSIEQPIRAKQIDHMQELCIKTAIPIALDEELIGVNVQLDGGGLLKFIKPQFIILKPTLLGGLAASDQWIKHAQYHTIGWWATSALESNIGLNAIAQWCANHETNLPQGLGTGSLYSNNIQSPLSVHQGYLHYNQNAFWSFPPNG
ncbi:MAG: o-succinylbenzoate synthase [Bacteroidota bacterium]